MKIKRYILPLVAMAGLVACNQEEINTNRLGVTDDDLRIGGLEYGTNLMSMQMQVIPIGSPSETTGPGNKLQATDLISSGNYIGYFGNNNNWGFNIESNWNFPANRMHFIYNNLYADISKPWMAIYRLAKGSEKPTDKRVLALANIIKIAGWLRATDAFGPIVFTEAGNGSITPKLDSQEVVYKSMLAELAESVQTLNSSNLPVMPDYDLVYNGDAAAWTRFANSLMLRMAVRVHFKDKTLAKEYIEKATNPANGGLIELASQVAKVASGAKLPLLSPYIASVTEYNETRMGGTIWAYLQGWGDPRISALFTESTDPRVVAYNLKYKYLPLPSTNTQGKVEKKAEGPHLASVPRLTEKAEVVWFRASETKFLLAEAALYGLYNGAKAQNLYEDGIRIAFEEVGATGADDYMKKSGVKTEGLNWSNNLFNEYSDDISTGNADPKWNERDSEEKKLQRIITQKYLALYPNAIEAWTEYRRTGYPFIMKPFDATAPSRIGATYKTRAPERFVYSATSYSSNPEMKNAPALLGGEDRGSTKLWWVRENRPVQQ